MSKSEKVPYKVKLQIGKRNKLQLGFSVYFPSFTVLKRCNTPSILQLIGMGDSKQEHNDSDARYTGPSPGRTAIVTDATERGSSA